MQSASLVWFGTSPMMVGQRKMQATLEASFQDLLATIEQVNPSESDLYEIFAPIRKRIWLKWISKWLSVAVCFAALCLAVYYVPSINWHATAVGRLIMIELLPYWDWTPLYRGKCLISKSKETSSSKKYEASFSFPDDCMVCQNVDTVPVRRNVSYETMFSRHLIRNTPLIVSDGQPYWNEHVRYGREWGIFFSDVEDLLLADPCDFRTNLLFKPTVAKTSAIARMIDVLVESEMESNANITDRGWFVQLRNCALRTVKKARIMFRKPYFYATHWEPPYTSWILLSRGYHKAPEMVPNMAGLVLVHQLRSHLNVVLRPRTECEQSCHTLSITLHERASLVFSSTMWNFSYTPSDKNQTSVTFATETYENA
ncbi:uncharacterized protein LOC128721692 [Anopheles nili]|uniref:uncharacterized protein LOC128721692 n=1 Tax=Anopheles nili TaxID=185578 RepID=UPI00237B796F|nr:uncharacterized protein LOC128721692 [Anopheles nili]